MDKETEKKILRSLKEDTYFAQYFGEDIEIMCNNIDMDLAIEGGCKFKKEYLDEIKSLNSQLFDLNEKLKNAKIECDGKLQDLEFKNLEEKKKVVRMIQHFESGYDELNDACIECVGEKEYLKIKLENNYDLTDNDRMLLVKML